jgi:hypothetical protein
MLDQEIILHCSTEALDHPDILLPPLTKAVFEEIRKKQMSIDEKPESLSSIQILKNKAQSKNREAYNLISYLIKESDGLGNKEKAKEYSAYGKELLMHPTLSKEERQEFIKNKTSSIYRYFIKMPAPADHYYCKTDKECEQMYEIYFEDPGKIKQRIEVSQDQTKLARLMQIPCVKEGFLLKGYAASWKPNDFMMPLVISRNLYQGRLGEAAGEMILSEWGLTLEEMPEEEFEVFDMMDPKNEVYIDFKNFNESFRVPEEPVIKHNFEKLRTSTYKKVIICNILAELPNDYICETYEQDDLRILVIPYLYGFKNEKPIENIDAIKAVHDFLQRKDGSNA